MTTTADHELAFEYATRALKYGAPWDANFCKAYLEHCKRIKRLEEELARACQQHEAAASKLWDSEQCCADLEGQCAAAKITAEAYRQAHVKVESESAHHFTLRRNAEKRCVQIERETVERLAESCSLIAATGGSAMHCVELLKSALASINAAAEQSHESASAAPYFPPCRGSIERREAEINAAEQANPRSSVQEEGASPPPAPAAAPRGVDASTWLQMQAQGQAFTTTERTLGIIEGLEIAEKIAQSYCFSAFRTVVDSVVTAIRVEIERRKK